MTYAAPCLRALFVAFAATLNPIKTSEPIMPSMSRKLATPANETATGILEDMTNLLVKVR